MFVGRTPEAERVRVIELANAKPLNSSSTIGQSNSPSGPSWKPSRLMMMNDASVRKVLY